LKKVEETDGRTVRSWVYYKDSTVVMSLC